MSIAKTKRLGQRSQVGKPRLSVSVGIQVRRLRSMAKDRHGSTAACGGTGDALSHVVEITARGTEARSHGGSPDAS